VIVVDDHHLFALLASQAGVDLQAELQAGQVFTTPSWYYRLARAAHDRGFVGALSRQIKALDLDDRELVLDQLDELPDVLGVLSSRVLVPVMAKLAGVHLNLLAAEAVASALIVEASMRVVAASQHLQSACDHFGVELVVTDTTG